MHAVSFWTPLRPARHSLSLTCQIVRERDFKLVARKIIDLSETGLLVKPIARVLTGEDVIVTFQAPYSRTWIDAEGVVARVIHGRRYGDFGMAIGIWLHGLDAPARALLRANLADAPQVPRSRGVRVPRGGDLVPALC